MVASYALRRLKLSLNSREMGGESRSHMPSVLEAHRARVGDDSLCLPLGRSGGARCADAT